MRMVLEVPDTYHRQIAERAKAENVSVRALIVWLIKTELAARAAAELAEQRALRSETVA